MNYYQLLPCNSFCQCESFNSSSWAWVGSVTNDHNLSTKSGLVACISYRISTDIHITIDCQVHCNCFNEPFAVSQNKRLYWDMHGLIFETSIWLLAGSTRYQAKQCIAQRHCITQLVSQTTFKTKVFGHSFNINPHNISTFSFPIEQPMPQDPSASIHCVPCTLLIHPTTPNECSL